MSINKFNKIEIAARHFLEKIIKLEKKENIVLVTDRKKCKIFDALKKICEKKRKGSVKILKLSENRENSSPIPMAKKVFSSADVIVAPTNKSISHSPETSWARKRGARVASMPGITPAMFVKAMKVNVDKVKKLNYFLYSMFRNSKFVEVTTPSGTNLVLNVRSVKWSIDDYGDISRKGVLNNVPFGEFCGYGMKADGKILIDYWEKKIKPKDRAIIELKNGKIVKWNRAAKKLVSTLRKAGECGLKTIEFGIGTNYTFKKPIGNVLYDEKVYGTAHVAFGGHGKVKCPIHIDVILWKPTISVDGRKVMREGTFIKNIC